MLKFPPGTSIDNRADVEYVSRKLKALRRALNADHLRYYNYLEADQNSTQIRQACRGYLETRGREKDVRVRRFELRKRFIIILKIRHMDLSGDMVVGFAAYTLWGS